MNKRFKVGDTITYNTTDKSFNYANGDYVIIAEKTSRFSDNNEEFQDLECTKVGETNGITHHFMDGAVTPNPYLSKKVPTLWETALKGAKYMVEECEYDYDSSAMDGFLTAIGCDVHDMEFMDWYFTNITKALGYEE